MSHVTDMNQTTPTLGVSPSFVDVDFKETPDLKDSHPRTCFSHLKKTNPGSFVAVNEFHMKGIITHPRLILGASII